MRCRCARTRHRLPDFHQTNRQDFMDSIWLRRIRLPNGLAGSDHVRFGFRPQSNPDYTLDPKHTFAISRPGTILLYARLRRTHADIHPSKKLGNGPFSKADRHLSQYGYLPPARKILLPRPGKAKLGSLKNPPQYQAVCVLSSVKQKTLQSSCRIRTLRA
jgi:hypothetical protein